MKRVALLLILAGLIVFGPALAFAQDPTPADSERLPKVVLVGDSIRLSYAEAVSKHLAGKATRQRDRHDGPPASPLNLPHHQSPDRPTPDLSGLSTVRCSHSNVPPQG